MKYTLLFLGHPRTGTTSLWNALTRHPEICGGKTKEKLPTNTLPYIEPEDYIDFFYQDYITDETKVLIDGSSVAVATDARVKYINEMKPNFSRVCCIYTLRDPLKRLESYLQMRIRRNFIYPKTPSRYAYLDLDNDCSIRYDYLKSSMNFVADEFSIIKKIETFVNRENLFICNLSEVEERQKEIYEFLSVSDFKFELSHLSKNAIRFSNDFNKILQLKIYNEILIWFDKNKSSLKKITNKSSKKIKKEYGIDIK